jgi:uroporphyrin-III C-methyltransferase
LTVRALQLIRCADVVLHDHLVSADVLAECGDATRIVDVGKIGHGAQADQATIEQQLVAFARAGHSVVRLKGGDPFIFGRGAEEAAALSRADVAFEIVPGVSSALAAPAYAGIPLTARGVAASVAIATGHCARSGDTPVHLPAADTIVVLMGIANAESIRDQLMAAGRSGETPAAVIEWGTCAQQRVVVGTLSALPSLIAREQLRAPSVIVVGDVVALRSELDWRCRASGLGWLRGSRLTGQRARG